MLFKGSYRKIEPASAAIIMAIGIFLMGTIEAFPTLNEHLGKLLAFILLITWIVIYLLLSLQFFHRAFLKSFIKDPINSFAMGTWIAGVSVLCHVFLEYFPSIIKFTQIMALFNSFLWLFFLITCVYNFKKLLFDANDYPVHGILLLSTVGTQSIIVLLNNVFFQLPTLISETVILIGVVFYFISVFLMSKWVVMKRNWALSDDWSNTNCIIHGALSITGLAMVSSQTFPPFAINLLWVIIFILIICVEAIELYRAIIRIKKYGWDKGVFSYHVSQWSRNFTFGMFYVFTLVMYKTPDYLLSESLNHFQASFIGVWAWIVLITLIVEIIIYLKHITKLAGLFNKKMFVRP